MLVALLALILIPALSTASNVQSQFGPLQEAARDVTSSEYTRLTRKSPCPTGIRDRPALTRRSIGSNRCW